MNKPIIRFFEPFEIVVVVIVNNEIKSYLDELQIT
jgi:hypothetical protein